MKGKYVPYLQIHDWVMNLRSRVIAGAGEQDDEEEVLIEQEEEECEVGEFRNNMTVTAGRLLRLSCPLASSPACLLATTR